MQGERRIRVHTMCVPVVKTPAEVLNAVDCVAVVSLLGKMGEQLMFVSDCRVHANDGATVQVHMEKHFTKVGVNIVRLHFLLPPKLLFFST